MTLTEKYCLKSESESKSKIINSVKKNNWDNNESNGVNNNHSNDANNMLSRI